MHTLLDVYVKLCNDKEFHKRFRTQPRKALEELGCSDPVLETILKGTRRDRREGMVREVQADLATGLGKMQLSPEDTAEVLQASPREQAYLIRQHLDVMREGRSSTTILAWNTNEMQVLDFTPEQIDSETPTKMVIRGKYFPAANNAVLKIGTKPFRASKVTGVDSDRSEMTVKNVVIKHPGSYELAVYDDGRDREAVSKNNLEVV